MLRGACMAWLGLASAGAAMAQAEPVLRRIAQALAEVKGDVLVVGHSDNQPIRSLRFPSNWHLSTARAENVKAAMAGLVEPARMRSSGKADAEPLAPNDSAESRARNRPRREELAEHQRPGRRGQRQQQFKRSSPRLVGPEAHGDGGKEDEIEPGMEQEERREIGLPALEQTKGAYLGADAPAGRSLDFLLQEFFREFNTMGSKCNNAEIAHHVVTAKTELEKIREQVQNAE